MAQRVTSLLWKQWLMEQSPGSRDIKLVHPNQLSDLVVAGYYIKWAPAHLNPPPGSPPAPSTAIFIHSGGRASGSWNRWCCHCRPWSYPCRPCRADGSAAHGHDAAQSQRGRPRSHCPVQPGKVRSRPPLRSVGSSPHCSRPWSGGSGGCGRALRRPRCGAYGFRSGSWRMGLAMFRWRWPCWSPGVGVGICNMWVKNKCPKMNFQIISMQIAGRNIYWIFLNLHDPQLF